MTTDDTLDQCGRSLDREAAIRRFRRRLDVQPDRVDLHIQLGEMLLRESAFEDALKSFRAALAIQPGSLTACRNLAWALELLGRRHDAVGAWFSLGLALETAARFEDAERAYHRALTLKPDCLRALTRSGRLQLLLGEPDQAVPLLKAAAAIDPDHVHTHLWLGWALHALGRHDEAWAEFEWYRHFSNRHSFEQPAWDGSRLDGRTILLWSDLALGDAVQCLRYVQFVKDRGARVVAQCPQTLLPLISRMPAVEEAVAAGAPLPAFDVHAPLLSLPRLYFAQHRAILCDVPYLSTDTVGEKRWAGRLAVRHGERTIGLVWASGSGGKQAHIKSVPLELMAQLTGVAHARFVSLQMGERWKELVNAGYRGKIDSVLSDSSTAADTAALIANLDLVITVDTFVAHLAGALARPVWILVPKGAAWWLWDRRGDVSSWYPTMRLFRQAVVGQWQETVDRVRAALEETSNPPTCRCCPAL